MNFVGPPSIGTTFERAWIPPSSWLHRRELTQEIGPWRAHSELSVYADCDFLSRTYRANKKIELSKELSVLKFPSARWHMYSRKAEFPQQVYLDKLISDPKKLHIDLLLDGACTISQSNHPVVRIRRLLRQIKNQIENNFMDLYGRDRWPIAQIIQRRFNRSLRLRQFERGIDSPKKA